MIFQNLEIYVKNFNAEKKKNRQEERFFCSENKRIIENKIGWDAIVIPKQLM